MVLCDRQLRRWYQDFNRRWFDGELPADADVFYALHEDCAGIADKEAGTFLILINPAYQVDLKIVRLTLLHEMVHVQLWPYRGHGKRFQEEMKRLASAGAFKGIW